MKKMVTQYNDNCLKCSGSGKTWDGKECTDCHLYPKTNLLYNKKTQKTKKTCFIECGKIYD